MNKLEYSSAKYLYAFHRIFFYYTSPVALQPKAPVNQETFRLRSPTCWSCPSCPIRSGHQTTSLPVADNWIDEDGAAMLTLFTCHGNIRPTV